MNKFVSARIAFAIGNILSQHYEAPIKKFFDSACPALKGSCRRAAFLFTSAQSTYNEHTY
jgi:hypothetical protein